MENLIFDIGFHKGEDTLFYLYERVSGNCCGC